MSSTTQSINNNDHKYTRSLLVVIAVMAAFKVLTRLLDIHRLISKRDKLQESHYDGFITMCTVVVTQSCTDTYHPT